MAAAATAVDLPAGTHGVTTPPRSGEVPLSPDRAKEGSAEGDAPNEPFTALQFMKAVFLADVAKPISKPYLLVFYCYQP